MKNLIILLCTLFAHTSFAANIAGTWVNPEEPDHLIQMISMKGYFHNYTVTQYGSYTITQNLKMRKSPGNILNGTVDFYDSRGCSFKGLAVTAEVQNASSVSMLMTVPQYKLQTITTQNNNDQVRYCTSGHRTYVCGRVRSRPTVKKQCRVLGYVEVPVQLYRVR